MVRIELGWHCPAPGEKAGRQPRGTQPGNSNLKNDWGTQQEENSLLSERSWEAEFTEIPLLEQRSWPGPLPSPALQLIKHRTTSTHGRQHSADISCSTHLHCAPFPCVLAGLPFSVTLALSQCSVLLPQKTSTNPACLHHISQPEGLAASVLVELVSGLIPQLYQSIPS